MHDPPEIEDVSLVRLAGFLRDSWKSLTISAAIGAVLFFAASHAVSPKYESEVLVRYRFEIDNLSAMKGEGSATTQSISRLAGLGAGSQPGGRDSSLAIATSRVFIFSFFTDEKIMPALFSGLWDEEKKDWSSDQPEERPSLLDGYEYFMNEILSVDDDSLRNLISFKIEVGEPEQARAWAAAIVKRLNEYIKAQKAEDVGKNIAFLQNRLQDTSIAEVRLALTTMLVRQIQQQMLIDVYDDYAFEILDPAVASDPEGYTYPNHLIWTALGLILGLMAGYALSLWRRLAV